MHGHVETCPGDKCSGDLQVAKRKKGRAPLFSPSHLHLNLSFPHASKGITSLPCNAHITPQASSRVANLKNFLKVIYKPLKRIYYLTKLSIRTASVAILCTIFLVHDQVPLATREKSELLFQESVGLYKQLITDPSKISNYEIWYSIAQAFYSIYRTYPDSPKAPNSLFLSGKLYEEMGNRFNSRENLEKSIGLSREFVRVYPDSNLTDDAQIRIARILEEWDKSQAYIEYEKVVIDFPKGDMVLAAKNKRDELSPFKPKVYKIPEKETASADADSDSKGLAQVKQIRHWSTDDSTRVVIHLDKEMSFDSRLLRPDPAIGAPPRLYVDIKGTTVNRNLYMEPIEKGLLEDIKFGRNTLDTVRVVLYIKSFKNYKVFSLHDPYRIVMDIYGDDINGDAVVKRSEPEEDSSLSGLPKLDGKDISALRGALGLKVRTVVIDPGHGGHDPGAIGPTGLKEKDVTLAIAKSLKRKIEESGSEFGITRVVLTRESDRFIPLEERTAIAKKERADLFISIHCNAAKNSSAHGIETYILSFTNDPDALAVAARENVTTTKGISDLKDIIKKYLLNSKIDESKRLASHVQTSVTTNVARKYQPVRNKGVKKAPFIVLIGADVPSILVETSFITNQREEKRLRNQDFLNEIADGIFAGIKRYSNEVETASVAR
jgi:N-acetylmuramoyl-L-alanine amidase